MIKFGLIFLFGFVMLFAGFLGYKKTKTVDDFVLGNRDIGPWLSAFAYGTTYFSAVLFIGYAGKIGYTFGLKGLLIAIGNAIIGNLLAWSILAKRTRKITAQLNARTMPEFLAYRYKLPIYKPIAALIIFVFLVPYSASVYMGLSYFFEAVFKFPYLYALLVMAVLTMIYLMLGGYHAVTLTDFIQGLIMIFGVFVMLYYLLNSEPVGGIGYVIEKLKTINPEFVSFGGAKNFIPLFFLTLLTSLGALGLPQMVQKFYAIKDEKSILPATIVSTVFALIIAGAAYATGALTPIFFKTIPIDPVTNKANADLLIPQTISLYLPDWASILIFLLVLSASMSTLASLVLVSSSAVVVDLLGHYSFFKKNKYQVIALRIFSSIFIIASVVIAIKKPAIILTLMALSWGAVSGSFLAPYFYGLYNNCVSGKSALLGTLSGLSLSILLAFYINFDAKYIPVTSVVGMIVPFILIPVFDFLFKKLFNVKV